MIDLVAIDGPVGVGKSSVASLLARRLGWKHLDTGAMYRSVAWAALAEGVDPEDEEGCEKIAQEMTLEFEPGPDLQRVRIGEEEITEAIRSEEVTTAVSTVADHPSVREELGKRQREMGAGGEAVAEGRDMGTVVFPRARWKFYLDADPRERMRRRGKQNEEQGREVDEKELLESIAERDRRDRERPVGALRVAEDAIVVDTTGMSLERVVTLLEQLVRGDVDQE